MSFGGAARCFVALTMATISGLAAAADAVASVSASVIAPIAITRSAELNFGSFAAGEAGEVRVDPDGSRVVTGATLVSAGSLPAAAQFQIGGAPHASFTISTLGTSTALTSGADSMSFMPRSALGGGPAMPGVPATATLDAAGTRSLLVGGTLTVGAAQAPGLYTGVIVVTVDYN